jgi:hypothetical protein
VNVYRAGSVAPAIALMTRRDSQIYVGQGFLPVLPSYPLHKAILARVIEGAFCFPQLFFARSVRVSSTAGSSAGARTN